MVAVLFSGGVDSFVHLQWAIDTYGAGRVLAVYFDVGQAYAARESRRAADLARGFFGVEFRLLRPMQLQEDVRTAQVLFRNVHFLLWAAALPERPTAVVFGMLHGETPADKTPAFVQETLDACLGKSAYSDGRACEILTPFAGCTKAGMLRRHIKAHGTAGLSLTVGCFNAEEPMCGACWCCFNRWVAWMENGLPSETYVEDPADAMVARLRALLRLPVHGPERRAMTLPAALRRWRWLLQAWRQVDRQTMRWHHRHALGLVWRP
jgi:7-cyano-7-deazaguanine synthase in queuosine biosynthesis